VRVLRARTNGATGTNRKKTTVGFFMDGKVDRRIAGLLAIGATVLACGASAASFPDHLSFQPSMHAGASDSDGKLIAGTEIMHLVPHQGRLYAGNSLWMENDPQVPKACQILVLDSPNGSWKVDHQFTRASTATINRRTTPAGFTAVSSRIAEV
jgi:hypothetical protein